jgi:glucose-6-phosphate 1-dehydrogenase
MLTAEKIFETADASNMVIFGVTDDLTERKLLSALVRMFSCGLVHKDSRIIGVVHNINEEQWRGL